MDNQSNIILETDRLNFSTWQLSDFSAAKKLWGDPKVTAFIDARGQLSDAQVKTKLTEQIELQKEHGIQYWAVRLKEDNDIIGCCGLRPYDIEKNILELGCHIMSEYWGKGFATEAASAAIAYAFQTLKAHELFAGHNPKNQTSARVLKKLGFSYTGDEFYEPTGLHHPSYRLLNTNPPA